MYRLTPLHKPSRPLRLKQKPRQTKFRQGFIIQKKLTANRQYFTSQSPHHKPLQQHLSMLLTWLGAGGLHA